MPIVTINLPCTSCGEPHQVDLDRNTLSPGQLSGIEPIIRGLNCIRVARLYRVGNFALDLRVNSLANEAPQQSTDHISEWFEADWGRKDLAIKIDRFKRLNLPILGVPEEYFGLIRQIISAYCCGFFYPAITSAGALGERILNLLMVRLRDYYKASSYYKKVYGKDSFDQWDLPINALQAWGVITADVAAEFRKLKEHRNKSIHYVAGYDFETEAFEAVKEIGKIINLQFGILERTDLYWVFTSPGEIFLRSAFEREPFIKEFVLPNCARFTAHCEFGTPGQNAPLGPLTDEQFFQARAAFKKTQGTAPSASSA